MRWPIRGDWPSKTHLCTWSFKRIRRVWKKISGATGSGSNYGGLFFSVFFACISAPQQSRDTRKALEGAGVTLCWWSLIAYGFSSRRGHCSSTSFSRSGSSFARYKDLSERQLKYILRIAELCDKKNIRLIAVSSPILNESLEYVDFYPKVHRVLKDFFKGIGVAYYDFNMSLAWKKSSSYNLFKDENHLNGKGADIFTHLLMDTLY